MNIQDRLRQYLEANNLTYREFETQCGLGNGTAASISEKTRRQTLQRIADGSKLNVEWLMTGKGDMINPNAKPITTISGPKSTASIPDDSIVVPSAVWSVIRKQADTLSKQTESLTARDELLSRMVSLLEAERADRRSSSNPPVK